MKNFSHSQPEIFSLNPQNFSSLSSELQKKVLLSLVIYAYKQTYVGLLSSIICATTIFIGLFFSESLRPRLYTWFAIYFTITFLRIVAAYLFSLDEHSQKKINFWANLYTLGGAIAGVVWGSLAIFIFPYANMPEQVLIVLILAGITAGATSLSSAVPLAGILFLIFSLSPFIFTLLLTHNYIYFLFDVAVIFYTIYSVTIVYKGYQLLKNAVVLQYENEELLADLSAAKEQLEESNKLLERAATHDPLTKIANRNLFYTRLENAINKAKSTKTKFALLYIDLDRFKLVNDIYGHHVGDQLLVSIVDRLKNFLHNDKIIARLGGDELAIILENMKSQEEVAHIAEEICRRIADPFRINNIGLKISASIGVSIYPKDAKTGSELLWQADRAMYQIKNEGGNYFEFCENLAEIA